MKNEFEPCDCATCGVRWGLPAGYIACRREDKRAFHCPNGHQNVYGENEADRLRRERDTLKQQMARVEEEARQARQRQDAAEASEQMARAREAKAHKAARAIRARIQGGACPDCNRTFGNLARHMATKHKLVCEAPPHG